MGQIKTRTLCGVDMQRQKFTVTGTFICRCLSCFWTPSATSTLRINWAGRRSIRQPWLAKLVSIAGHHVCYPSNVTLNMLDKTVN